MDSEKIELDSSMKLQVKQYMKQIKTDIDQMLQDIDQKEICILCELERIKKIYNKMQKSAASFYLQAYLSPFTDHHLILSSALQSLSAQKHGALIVIQREDHLDPFIHNGTPVNAILSSFLLESIFYPGSPLHDGAVLVRNNLIVSAGNVLPLSSLATTDSNIGMRHRAALGLSELSDALILVVSEETGTTSFAFKGELYPIDSPE
ncbi:sporulation-specific diadenylate cyclase CdaS [Thermoflavimicrobium daqui]|jgi:uncharacterized protein (TIGR00159 family)|uniref:Diadenylate cyclase n=1 Tax=Thermoflavimicrobium daqui TaxID=2137476 RepID=A0A364K826_9BACL|nr:sporulation-specific diadenylate cyclase CdaS [Thermoflavimicrobium daqui]RAL26456.1 hypothetical protein DL897_05550 [Thermoflavimicrobium daqui]